MRRAFCAVALLALACLLVRAGEQRRKQDRPGGLSYHMRRAFCAVALLALACLLVRAARVGLTGEYIDPVGKIAAQDEAYYANPAIAMAREGGWLTPRFMGRYTLFKPPLLVWAAAFSSKILGVSRLGLRQIGRAS